MTCNLDTVGIVNTLFCIVILVLGFWGYKKTGNRLPFSIGLAFGMFGFSHILKLLGFATVSTGPLLLVRILAYLIIALALYRVAVKQ